MRPLRFLVYSRAGEGLSLAWRLQQEGHAVRFFVLEPPSRGAGRGLLNTTAVGDPLRGEITIFTDTGFAPKGRLLRQRGFAVVGGNSLETVERDRATGMRLMHARGLDTPETYDFHTVAAGLKFLNANEGAWFFKPDNAPANMTRNAPTSESMVRFLRWVAPQLKTQEFALQRKVDGTEVDVDIWCNGRDIVGPSSVDLEEKKALAGELGPRTGCQSNVVFSTRDKIVQETIGRFADDLVTTGYVGCFSINTIIAKDSTMYGLEFTARFGYDALEAWSAMLTPGTIGEQFAELAAGGLSEWDTLPDAPYAMTLRLSTPPFPLDAPVENAKAKGLPLDDALLARADFIPVEDFALDSAGLPVGAGNGGGFGVLVQVGHTLEQLRGALLESAESLDVPALQYRIDPVKSAEERLDALRELGLIDRKPTYRPHLDSLVEEQRVMERSMQRNRRTHTDDGTNEGEHTQTGGFASPTHPVDPSPTAPMSAGSDSSPSPE